MSNADVRLVAPLLFFSATLVLGVTSASADEVSLRSEFYARLAAPMTSVVEGKAFRPALENLAAGAKINVWIDRKIDPSEPVSPGQVGPTVYSALRDIAATHGAVTMPIARVVLVGRPQWVEATAASLLSLESRDAGKDRDIMDVQWPTAVTPAEALAAIITVPPAEVDPALPYDLWPSVHWSRIDRDVAATLVLAQFNRKLGASTGNTIGSVPSSATGSFVRRYASDSIDGAFRDSIRKVDPKAQVRVRDKWLEVGSSIAAHRAATDKLLEQARAARPATVDIDARDRKLTLENAPAGAVLMQLAAAANRKCVITAEAQQACQQLVSFEADQTTLRELADRVAKFAGVVAIWSNDQLLVTSAN